MLSSLAVIDKKDEIIVLLQITLLAVMSSKLSSAVMIISPASLDF